LASPAHRHYSDGSSEAPKSPTFCTRTTTETLGRLAARDCELATCIELDVVGGTAVAANSWAAVRVVQDGFLAHDDAIVLMRSANVSLLPMHDLPNTVQTRTVPGTTYEYPACGQTIFIALPDDPRLPDDVARTLDNVFCRASG
jgi:hypothetical protein